MKQLRIALLVFFLATAAVFSYVYIQRRFTADRTAPYITADTDYITATISATDEDLLAGMKAFDDRDGEVTDRLVVVSKSKFISKGTVHVRYAAFDSNRNVGLYTRELTYVDYVSPRFHLYSPLRFASGASGYDCLDYVTAEDCLDGNITQQIKISFGKTTTVDGETTTQTVNLQVTNRSGDTSTLELPLTKEDFVTYSRLCPALKEYVVYVPKGGRIDLRSYLSGIWSAGKVRGFDDSDFDPYHDITIVSTGLDLNKAGVYTVTYKLARSTGEQLGTTDLIVIVED